MSLIIIADDDELVVDIVRQSLENRGHVVGTLDDGRAVKSVVEIKRPDLVILDCSMDDVSGIIALREIRASRKAPTTPVLMLTSRCSSADEEIARLAGADDYLRKPFDTDELVARVEVLLEKSAEYQARRAPPDVSDGAAARGVSH
jgi:DNA-binding response OmpR family regulator